MLPELGEHPEAGVEPFVGDQPRDREQPATVPQTVTGSHLSRVAPRLKEDRIGTERKGADQVGCGLDLEPLQYRKAEVRGPPADRDHHRRGAQQSTGRAAFERGPQDLLLKDQQIRPDHHDAVRSPEPRRCPPGRVRSRLEVATPDELSVGRPGERRHTPRPEQ